MKFMQTTIYERNDDFAGVLKETLTQAKIVLLKEVPQQTDYLGFYETLTDQLGVIVDADENEQSGQRSHNRWSDIRYDKSKATTFRYSNTRQPLHTDTAYTSYDNDVNFFFCLESAPVGGATYFLDGVQLVSILEIHAPQLLKNLKMNKVLFDKGAGEYRQEKIISSDSEGLLLNWNYFRVSKENSADVRTMCEEFHHFLELRVVEGGLLEAVKLDIGECVFFQDRRVLHGRYSFLGNRNLIKGALNFA